MMECNPGQPTRNKRLGTQLVAEEAGLNGYEKLDLESAAKAAWSERAMGATKRLATLVSVVEGVHRAVSGYRSAAAG